MMATRAFSILVYALSWIALVPTVFAKNTSYIYGVGMDGATRQLAVDRTPALYTGDFGDCLGGESLINVTKFDAAFYWDNSTILMHLDGSSNIRHDSLLMYISVNAYGVDRYSQFFDPCYVNVYSLCPLNSTVPVTGFVLFQVGPLQIDIPEIAYQIPDFEGYARIQIFSNSSKTEIACFQAVMKNGNTFSQPAAISPVLGIFTVVAIISSFLTAAYGVSVTHMRTHYAHSLSVLVIFETFQSIFFSGALSVNFPSVLPAWWSNFAWAAGLIPSSSMIASLDSFTGTYGNISQVGAAGSSTINNDGGLASTVYGRSLEFAENLKRTPDLVEAAAAAVLKRQPYNESDPFDYNWEGNPVTPGLPLPGDWSGFTGNLAELGIPAADAFMIAFVWLLAAIGLVAFLVIAFKFTLDGLAWLGLIKEDRLAFFRSHWKGYTCVAVLRTLFIAFFSMMIMAMFQFALHGPAGPTALAAIVFIGMLIGIGGIVAFALHTRYRHGKFHLDPDRIIFQRGKILGCIPFPVPVLHSQLGEKEFERKPVRSLPFFRWHFVDEDKTRKSVHEDEAYIKRFGWLSARYRLSRWWYFAFWLTYQFLRAAFVGGAAGNPEAQIFGLLVVDVLSLIVIAAINPYEGQRNTALAVWLLGLSKVATTGLSIAFLPTVNLDRILATVIGVIIVIVQAFLTIALMILVILGGISSWMSLTRNQEYFSSRLLEGTRIKYFEHLTVRATDKKLTAEQEEELLGRPRPKPKPRSRTLPRRPAVPEAIKEEPETLPDPSFNVTAVRRTPKIEDEDDEFLAEMSPAQDQPESSTADVANRRSRATSVSSRHSVSSLPRRARTHRASWSSRDFSQWQMDSDRPGSAYTQRLSGYTPTNSASMAGLPEVPAPATGLRAPSNAAGRPMTPAKEEMEKEAEGNIAEDSENKEPEREASHPTKAIVETAETPASVPDEPVANKPPHHENENTEITETTESSS